MALNHERVPRAGGAPMLGVHPCPAGWVIVVRTGDGTAIARKVLATETEAQGEALLLRRALSDAPHGDSLAVLSRWQGRPVTVRRWWRK